MKWHVVHEYMIWGRQNHCNIEQNVRRLVRTRFKDRTESDREDRKKWSKFPRHPLSDLILLSLAQRYIQPLLPLVELLHYGPLIGREVQSFAPPALLCHKEPAHGTQSPLLGAFLAFHWFFMVWEWLPCQERIYHHIYHCMEFMFYKGRNYTMVHLCQQST